MTSHSVSLAIAKMIRDGLLVDDGFAKPCQGDRLNPYWAEARANNIATAIAVTFDCRPNEVAGETETPDFNDPRIK